MINPKQCKGCMHLKTESITSGGTVYEYLTCYKKSQHGRIVDSYLQRECKTKKFREE